MSSLPPLSNKERKQKAALHAPITFPKDFITRQRAQRQFRVAAKTPDPGMDGRMATSPPRSRGALSELPRMTSDSADDMLPNFLPTSGNTSNFQPLSRPTTTLSPMRDKSAGGSTLSNTLELALSILRRMKAEKRFLSSEEERVFADLQHEGKQVSQLNMSLTSPVKAAESSSTGFRHVGSLLIKRPPSSQQQDNPMTSQSSAPSSAATSTASRTSFKKKGGGASLLAAVRSIIAAPQVYKEMLNSKDDVMSLSQFALTCTSINDQEELAETIAKQFEGMLPPLPSASGQGEATAASTPAASRLRVFVGEEGGNGLCLLSRRPVDVEDGFPPELARTLLDTTVHKDHPLTRLALDPKPDNVSFENGNLYILLTTDKTVYGAVMMKDIDPSSYDEQTKRVILANSGIAAMALRSARNFNQLRSLNAKSAELLSMAGELETDTSVDERQMVDHLMEKAKALVDADRCTFFPLEVLKEGGSSAGSRLGTPANNRARRRSLTASTAGISTNSESPPQESAVPPPLPASLSIARRVVEQRDMLNIRNIHESEFDCRAQDEMERSTGYKLKSVMCFPIEQDGALVGVAQVVNKQCRTLLGNVFDIPFTEEDVRVFRMFVHFVGIAIRNCRATLSLVAEKRKTEAILRVVSHLSTTDIRNVSSVVSTVMRCAKDLLSADRSSLFLIDEEHHELYSKVADSTGGQELRFPMGRGIAGTVAFTGESENIQDAYQDDRFNREFDRKLGYRTQSILCEPIACQGDILAVAQLVNKCDKNGVGVFTQEDEETFRTFAMFAGIALSNSRLLEFTIKAGQEAMMLGTQAFGSTGSNPTLSSSGVAYQRVKDTEREEIWDTEFPDAGEGGADFTSRNYNMFAWRERFDADEQKQSRNCAALLAIKVIEATGYLDQFNVDREILTNFVVRCRGKYRQVPYHNFYHAVDVCQTIYTFLFEGGVKELLSDLDCFVLLVTALVHDIDHMGLNNNFHLKTDSPLGILSSASGNSSVLEVHHCNLAIEILMEPTSALFSGLNTEQSASAYRSLVDCILATDMARHGDLMGKWKEMTATGYDKANPDNRKLLMQMVTKAADVSNVTKPFDVSRLWATSVTEEFYKQGDREREKGLDVNPMFDRTKGGELAKGQIGFIKGLCVGFFGALTEGALSGLSWTMENMETNLERWSELLDDEEN